MEEYITRSKEERQKHLDLESPCMERGGNSTMFKGLLAHYLDTNIPYRMVDLCHACHNGGCSNPQHLYWGTRKENIEDMKATGNFKTCWEKSVEKYGEEVARTKQGRAGNKNAKKALMVE